MRKVTMTGMRPFPSKEIEEYEWDRVQRMRAEGHWLIKGGQYREPGTRVFMEPGNKGKANHRP